MTNYDKLIDTLREVFMLDKAELDFGIYRIMNQKRKDIEQFLEKDLVPQVKQVLAESLSIDTQAIKKELDDAIKSLQSLGVDPNTSDKVQQMKARLGQAGDLLGMENEVFSLLTNFFRRYFDNGDFISMRRYKKDIYAIPYEGEEVKLHWANADQYYIKTSEYFKNYRFKLGNGKIVDFQLLEASTEQNNNKSQNNSVRRFALHKDRLPEEKDGEFIIYFTYEQYNKKIKQGDLLIQAFDAIKDNIPHNFIALLSIVDKIKSRTLLEKHLLDYFSRNTFDYFIHKDLGGFLKRELDFYIKNEVLFIDDLNTRDEQEFLKQLSKIKAIKKVGEKIIIFLAQLENFQKKLWLKKKFVVQTNYCITLDKVPIELYNDILNNQKQIEDWVNLFSIGDSNKQNAEDLFQPAKVKFSNPLSLEFLKENPLLVLDTVYFSSKFKWKLISSIDNFDDKCAGLLINSENFQALGMLSKRYKKEISTIYIDPPFNTGSDFAYKDNFQTSSWLSLLSDRISISKQLLKENGSFYLHLDYNANYLGRHLLDFQFGENNFLNEITWQRSTSVGSSKAIAKRFPTLSDTIFLYVKDKNQYKFNKKYTPASEEYKARFKEEDSYGFYYWNTLAGFSQETYDRLESQDRVRWTEGAKFPQYKTYLHELKGNVVPDVWTDINMLNPMASERTIVDFITQKPESLISRVLESSSDINDIVLDFFNGSGTTSATALKSQRKFIGVEMAEYFYGKILPRMKRVLNGEKIGISESSNWKGGGFIKYVNLESYEDTLNNLSIKQDDLQLNVLEANPSFKEGYTLEYMLDNETETDLLNLTWFINPFECYLNITKNNELIATNIDLVETFNYLIGLVVENYAVPKDGYVVVTGKNLESDKILVVWRDCTIHDNASLNSFLEKSKYNPLDSEYDRVYVNGDNNVENLKVGDERWKVILIEEEFKYRMFENY